MKIVYMTDTISLIAKQEGNDYANNLVSQGDIKETEEGVQYLLITV